jgi:glycosyltransferase involved in cell wall biosynthesis
MIVLIFRRKTEKFFSIEKLYDRIYAHFLETGTSVQRLELPYVSSGIANVLRNAWFVARRRARGILHITGDVHYAALLCPFAKVVITVQDSVVLQRGSGLKRLVLWLLWFGLPLRMASAITVASGQTRRDVLKAVAVPARKITIIPHFVDPGLEFSERIFDAACPRILHVGITPNKNLSRVILALRDIPCTLVIVGAVPEATIADLKLAGIRYENFVGVDDAKMARLYRDADIVSFPSTFEGWGMPILEAQAVGRVVITSDREPMRTVAGPGGALLVEPESVAAIREGFLTVINDPDLRRRLVAAGRENCKSYTLESAAAQYLALYRALGEG